MKTDKPISPAQRRILTSIHKLVKKTGLPPTRKEIADDVGQYPNGVQEILQKLHRKGYIILTSGISRGIRLRRIK